jgi:hypothetical protein
VINRNINAAKSAGASVRLLQGAGCCTASVSLLLYYLLPRTNLQSITPGYWILCLSEYVSRPIAYGISVAFCIGVVALVAYTEFKFLHFTSSARNENWSLPIWIPLTVFFVPMLVIVVSPKSNAVLSAAVCSIMVAICTGIVAAFITGSVGRAILGLLIAVCVQSAFALYLRNSSANLILSGTLLREGGTFNDPQALSALCAVGASVGLAGLMLANTSSNQLFYGLFAALSISGLIVTWDRGASFALSAALIWFSLKYPLPKSTRIMVVTATVLLSLFVLASRSLGAANYASNYQSAANRLIIWQRGFANFEQHWLGGADIGSLTIHFNAPTDTSHGKMLPQAVDGPESEYLFFLDEFGVSGIVILLLFYICIRNLLKRSVDHGEYSALLSVAWATLAIYSLVNTPFGGPSQPSGNAMVGFLIGATILVGRKTLGGIANPADSGNNGARADVPTIGALGADTH